MEQINVIKIMEKIKSEIAIRKEHIKNQQLKKTSSIQSLPSYDDWNQIDFPQKKSYHVKEFLSLHDEIFIRTVYRTLLKREPDEAGLYHYLILLRENKMEKIEFLWIIKNSSEGKNNQIEIIDLDKKFNKHKFRSLFLHKIPVIRYINKLIFALIKLPKHIEYLNGLERYLLAKINDNHKLSYSLITSAYKKTEESTKFNEAVNELKMQELQNAFNALNHIVAIELKRDMNRFAELLNENSSKYNELLTELSLVDNKISSIQHNLDRELSRINKILIDQDLDLISDNKFNVDLDSLYVHFEDTFRGSREEIKLRQVTYLDYIKSANAGSNEAPILDLGCGRGEWLELLKENILIAKGADLNHTMIEYCKKLNLEVVEADVIQFLSTQADNSFGAITGFHIVEHLSYKRLIRLFDETYRVLKPGGVVIFETPNPENMIVGSCNFYIDPTHRNPLPPVLLKFLADSRGFQNTQILRLHPAEFYQNKLLASGWDSEIIKLFTNHQDYSVIAYKEV